MFTASLRSVLLAVVAYSVAASAAPGLELRLSGADEVNGVDNLKLTTSLTNTGDETLKLLNDPRGPLNKLPTETFMIIHDSGAVPDFIGAKVSAILCNSLRHSVHSLF